MIALATRADTPELVPMPSKSWVLVLLLSSKSTAQIIVPPRQSAFALCNLSCIEGPLS